MFIILSIKPKYAEAILSGKKKYEFRKDPFSRDAQFVVIYSSAPVCKIVGWFKIKRQYVDRPENMWIRFSDKAGITKTEFDEYFREKDKGVCLEIEDVKTIDPPIDPFILIDDFVAPQSYRYVNGRDRAELSPMIDILKNQMKIDEILV